MFQGVHKVLKCILCDSGSLRFGCTCGPPHSPSAPRTTAVSLCSLLSNAGDGCSHRHQIVTTTRRGCRSNCGDGHPLSFQYVLIVHDGRDSQEAGKRRERKEFAEEMMDNYHLYPTITMFNCTIKFLQSA